MHAPLRHATLALAAAVLVAAAVAPATSAQSDENVAPPCDLDVSEPAFADEAEVQDWDGDVAEDVDGGDLRLASYRSGVYLEPWNRSSWRVEVGEVDPDDELEPNVTASTDDGRLSLTVRYDDGPSLADLGMGSGSAPEAQVKAWVPQEVYRDVLVRDGSGASVTVADGAGDADAAWTGFRVDGVAADVVTLEGEDHDVHAGNLSAGETRILLEDGGTSLAASSPGALDLSGEDEAACFQGATMEGTQVSMGDGDATFRNATLGTLEASLDGGDLELAETRATAVEANLGDGTFLFEGLAADDVSVTGDEGELHGRRAEVGAFSAALDDVNASLAEVEATDLEVNIDDGDLDARDLRVSDLQLDTDDGDVEADLVPRGNSTWNLTSDAGSVDLHVPVDDEMAYDAVVTTDEGEPQLDIPGTEVVSRSEGRLHVRTPEFSSHPTRTHLEVHSDDGAVTSDDELRSTGIVPATNPTSIAAGAGLLAILGAVATVAWPKLRPLVAPLYSRIGAHEVLHHPVRSEIHDVVGEEPGIHFRELQRRLEAGRGALEHHLDKLVDANVLAEDEAEGYTCYFVQGSVDPEIVAVAPLLRTDTARDLLAAAAEAPGASVNALSEAADVSNSTASYHLDKLEEAGLVAKDRGGHGLEVAPTELGSRALDELALEAELAVSSGG